MYYKLLNTATKNDIEEEFNLQFQFPNLYKVENIIEGLKESVLSIITIEHKNYISYGIWGLLPKKYNGNWSDFQAVTNTLNIDFKSFKADAKYRKILRRRRCLIIVTGFITTVLKNGKLEYYYVNNIFKKPFALAGVYNRLEDGFITCSLVTVKSSPFIRTIQNINNRMPLFLGKKNQNLWLDEDTPLETLFDLMKFPEDYPLTYQKKNITVEV
ncbi:SOS response-associated peptidase family protein [Urechidicola croceus]|uniref:Abasic site processing protein n=1 Tax=Urechidicola croceus TaxID=1850246 RepID=A0A1D8PAB9_9FLAO|nr:SOS response-associated peptidase family protein [Urechidicola croceus]AOW21513.1 hypothetical protein LPB138_12860 [Urechidicola croceus]